MSDTGYLAGMEALRSAALTSLTGLAGLARSPALTSLNSLNRLNKLTYLTWEFDQVSDTGYLAGMETLSSPVLTSLKV